jgi:pyridoxamine 5'-phosphate oxidase
MSENLDDLKNNHQDFSKGTLENNMDKDPFEFFSRWFDEAVNVEELEVNACVISTVSSDLQPSARIVYLKEIVDNGFVFYTNYASQKGKEIALNPKASMLFFWPKNERQVRIEGVIVKLADAISDAYFDARPLQSKLGAWASHQSEELRDVQEIQDRMVYYGEKFGSAVPRPPHWGGYSLSPTVMEFWQGRPSRLHDRIVFTASKNSWLISRKNP